MDHRPEERSLDRAEMPEAEPANVTLRRKSLLIAVLVALGAIAIAYGVGRLQAAARVADAETRAEQQKQESKARTEQLRSALKSAQERSLRLEARRQLHVAIMALDQRNFGIAQGHLARASQLLTMSEVSANKPLGQLKQAMAKMRLKATEDLSGQRNKILGRAKQFDELVPPPRP